MVRKSWLIAFIALFPFSSANGGEQGWFSAGVDLDVLPQTTLSLERETRSRKATFDQDFLKAVHAIVSRSLPHHFWAGAGFRKETITRASGSTDENRGIFQTGWKPPLGGGVSGDLRAQVETRNYVQPSQPDHTRFRLRTGITKKIIFYGKSYGPYVYFELFGDSLDDKVNRNRLYAGTTVSLTDSVKLRLGYIRQDTEGVEKDHALQMGIKGSF